MADDMRPGNSQARDMDGEWCPQLEFSAHSALLRLGKPWNGELTLVAAPPISRMALKDGSPPNQLVLRPPPFVPSEFRRNLLPVHSLLPGTSVAVFEAIPHDLVPIGHHEC
jgi:hypothetical protein